MTPFPDASAELGPGPQILDLLDEGALLVGPKDRIVWINKALRHCLEVDRDGLIGSDAREFLRRFLLPRIVEEECREAISASLRDRSNLPALACTIMTADGREQRTRVSSMTGEDNRMHLVRLQDLPGPGAEQEMLATILSYLPETVNILDRDLRFVHIDREFARQIGREPREMVGKTWEELGFSMEGAGPYFETVREVFATGKQVRGKVRHVVVRGFEYSEYISVPIPGPSGRVERVLTVSRDITDRKRAERELAHKHELLQTIIDTIPVMITIYDPNLKTFRFNRALRETLGWTEEDASSGDIMALCYPDPGYREMVARFMQSLEPGWRDFVLTAKDGSLVESSWANIRLSDDTRVGIGIDIRERTAGERALRESEERFRSIYERSGTGIALVGLDGRITDSNPAFRKMLGYRPDTLHGRHFADITYPGDLPKDTALAASLMAGDIDTYRLEKRYVTQDGRILWGMLTASLIRDAEGRPESLIGMVENITERKQMEDALRESEERYRSLVEVMPDGVVVYRSDIITYVNPACIRIAGGKRPEDFVGRSLDDFVSREHRDLVIEQIRRMGQEGTATPFFEEELRTLDGRRIWVNITTTPILYQGRPSTMVVFRDVTERKQAEAALREQTDELTRVNRELDEAHREANLYLDILTHDVRNANNVSTMYADVLLELLEGEPKTYAQKLHDSIRRSTEILKNVAAIRRIHQESASLSPVDLAAVIQDEIGAFPAASIRYDGRPALVCADGLLSMVFTNLIGNAVKFGGPDVRITIRVEELNGEVLVSVEDTGPGVPDEVKGVLFRRFERGIAKGKGEGLGLYIVRTLVERYGGRVRVEDRIPEHPEKGAAFRFTLVKALQGAARADPSPEEEKPEGSRAADCECLRSIVDIVKDGVLVADDAGNLREANPAACTLLGYTREELLQRSVFAICKVREAGREFWQRFLERGVMQGECDLLRKDGTTVGVECSAVARIAPGIHAVVVRPLSGQTETEETLQFERDQLLSIFDGLEEIVYVTDPVTYEILYANPFFTKLLGRNVVGGLCYRDFQGLAAPCPFCTNDIILRQKPQPYRWEYYNPSLDVHLDIVDRIIRWPDGRDVRLEVAIDITERKRAELALQESEGQFRALLNATPDATVLIDRDGTILALNEAMAARFGRGAEDLRETCVYDLFPPNKAAVRKRQVDEAFSSGRPGRLTDEYAGRFFDVILFPIRSADGQVRRLAVISSDITDQKEVERIRREAFDRIERNMEQFAILGDHVRHPLQVLLARADLTDDEATAEKVREQVRRINGYIKDLDQGWIESRKIREFLRRNEMA